MPKRPAYLAEFADEDAAWFVEHGEERRVRPGDVVIQEKVTPEHIFITLRGRFMVSSVSLAQSSNHGTRVLNIQRIGPGELLGEMSYINREPPGSSVIAETNGLLLAVPRADIRARSIADPAFAERFDRVALNFSNSRLWRFVRRRLPPDNPDPPPPQGPPNPLGPRPPDPPSPELEQRLKELLELILTLLRGDLSVKKRRRRKSDDG